MSLVPTTDGPTLWYVEYNKYKYSSAYLSY